MLANIIISNNQFEVTFKLVKNRRNKLSIKNQTTKALTNVFFNVDKNFETDDLRMYRYDFNPSSIDLDTKFKVTKLVINGQLALHVKGKIESDDNYEYYITNVDSDDIIVDTFAENLQTSHYNNGEYLNLEFCGNYFNGISENREITMDGSLDSFMSIVNYNKRLVEKTSGLTLNIGSVKFEDGKIFKLGEQIYPQITEDVKVAKPTEIINVVESVNVDKQRLITGININIEKFKEVFRKIIYGVGLSGNGLLNFGYYDGDSDETKDSELIIGAGTKDKPKILLYIKDQMLNGLSGINIKPENEKNESEFLMTSGRKFSITEMMRIFRNQRQYIIQKDNLVVELTHNKYIPTITFFIQDAVDFSLEKIDLPYKINKEVSKVEILYYPAISEKSILIMIVNR